MRDGMESTMSFMEGLSENFLQRLAGGNMHPAQANDEQDMGQLMSSASQQQFQQQVTSALQQTDPQEYGNHVTPGAGGTNPLGSLGQGTLGSVAGSLLQNLTAGGGLQNLASRIGLSTTNPQQMSEQDVAKMAQHAQQNDPGALAQTAAQYQDKPDVLRSILGNKALLIAGAGLAAGVLSGQLKPKL
jgi:hypothetical protein